MTGLAAPGTCPSPKHLPSWPQLPEDCVELCRVVEHLQDSAVVCDREVDSVADFSHAVKNVSHKTPEQKD